MILDLAYYGEAILRKKTRRVEKIDDDVLRLIEDMKETMYHHDGAGLSATQVFREEAVCLSHVPVRDAEGKYIVDDEGRIAQWKDNVYINPKIVAVSKETWLFNEGCLSIPGVWEDIERPVSMRVEYMNLDGELVEEELQGYEGRVLFHENDHLNGVLIIDRLPRKKRAALEPVLRKIKKKYR